MRSRALEHTYARANWGLKFRPTDQHWVDTDINVNEPVASGETDIDVTPNASTAIPVGTVIRMDSEVMGVTATGTTLTVVRQDAVTHSNGIDIYKLVQSCVLWLPGQDDPQSAVIRDRSGNGNDGTITGATWAQTGQGLVYLDFDGGDDVVSFGDILPSAPRVFEFWMRTSETDDGGIFTFEGDARYAGLSIRSGNWASVYNDVRSKYRFFTLTGNDGVWHQFFLYCPTNVEDSELWIDTVQVGVASTAGTGAAGNWDDFVIGKSAYGLSDIDIALKRIHSAWPSASVRTGRYNQERHLFGV